MVNCGSIKIPRGAVVEGEIVDIDVVSYSLSELWRKTGLSDKRVIIGIANQKIVIRLIEVPYMEKEDLKGALQYQVQDYIPLPVEEVILDFQVVGDYTVESGERMLQILLVAAQRDMINSVVAAVEKAGLRPEVIDVSAFAIVRSLLGMPALASQVLPEERPQEEAVALVNMGAGITSIVVAEKDIIRFARDIALAGDDLTEVLSDSLGVSFDEAEDLKIRVGLPPLVGDRFVNVPSELLDRAETVQDVLEREVLKFLSEIRRSFDYYLAQTPTAELRKVILTGSPAKLRYFRSYFEREIGLEILAGHPLDQVQISPRLAVEALKEDELSLAICIGLALGGLEE
jgi:type IV pilus assembly protein PilM